MTVKEPVEFLYLALMLRWETSAPPLGKQGLLDGKAERNTQISRMVYVLRKLATGAIDKTFYSLSRTARRYDGNAYISMDKSWMKEPTELFDGWYFEGCTNLIQKQKILQGLPQLGLSPVFVACADDFVAGKSVRQYIPSENEVTEILEDLEYA
jgi:hypothetical protein